MLRTLECRPDSYQGWYNQGNDLRDKGNYQDALASYSKAIEYHPHDYWAIIYLEKAIDLEPRKYLDLATSDRLWQTLSKTIGFQLLIQNKSQLGDLALARKLCDRALKIATELNIPLAKECQILREKL